MGVTYNLHELLENLRSVVCKKRQDISDPRLFKNTELDNEKWAFIDRRKIMTSRQSSATNLCNLQSQGHTLGSYFEPKKNVH